MEQDWQSIEHGQDWIVVSEGGRNTGVEVEGNAGESRDIRVEAKGNAGESWDIRAEAEGNAGKSQDIGAEAGGGVEDGVERGAEGVPLTITPPPDKH